MFYKIHSIQQQKVLAVCDKELSGKILDEEIGFKVKPEFYGTELISEEELKKKIKEVNSANFVGKKCVKIALNKKIVLKENIIKIKDVPHIQIYFIEVLEENK
ncbi:MAG: DUF424 domain-containing protein [Candidatus Diapherotrites archaeon CG10_big_fil_rev_8_21_14_0_10_31_34]|nr:MAG: DUF424 domain-containing protein [Candidatus Diapherotrites archaeon CG10_big_fil_rev_8_21_14_0_10_31_34]PJA21324.1 MAG: DUF424 domain-containing protein [Candidatus Diapherotrites archaeon CG_4_10_14_0_2_um_filter_31_5]